MTCQSSSHISIVDWMSVAVTTSMITSLLFPHLRVGSLWRPLLSLGAASTAIQWRNICTGESQDATNTQRCRLCWDTVNRMAVLPCILDEHQMLSRQSTHCTTEKSVLPRRSGMLQGPTVSHQENGDECMYAPSKASGSLQPCWERKYDFRSV